MPPKRKTLKIDTSMKPTRRPKPVSPQRWQNRFDTLREMDEDIFMRHFEMQERHINELQQIVDDMYQYFILDKGL